MQLELIFSNDRRFLSSVGAFAREALKQWPLQADVAQKLGELVIAAAANAIECAYPAGEEGSIKLSICEQHGRLEFLVRDDGLPVDVEALEKQMHGGQPRSGILNLPGADAADEVHWIGYGREGKAIQIIKWLHDDHVENTAGAVLTPFHDEAPLAPPQEYTIRRLLPNEALQVSQLMYQAYGNTYFNENVYYPERVATLNANDKVLSFVAVGTGGKLAGHYALELNQEGPVAEGGQAVVDPAHRGRGLLDRMKDAALEEAKRRNLAGCYADAVSVHTMTQQSDLKHGARLTCADLAIAPASENFKNISTIQSQRVTCLLFFQWLQPPTPRKVYVPERHREIATTIYANLECPVKFGNPAMATGQGTLKVSLDSGAGTAFIRPGILGTDTLQLIRHAKREVLEREHAEVVYVELPLSDPATPGIADELEAEGFGFLGIAPCFSLRGDLLRLAYLVTPLAREPIKTVDEFTGQMVDYALAEQLRVQAGL